MPTLVVFFTPRPTKLNGLSGAPPELRQIHTPSPGSLFYGMLLTERK
jgi:hypothetical protein